MLTNAALLFVLVIIAVIILQWGIAPSYSLTNKQVQERVLNPETLVLPHQLHEMVSNGQLDNYTLVDLRKNPTRFAAFKNTRAIPFADILHPSSLKQIKQEGQILLLGDNESQAMMALNLLTAKGFSNVSALANNATFIQEKVLSDFKPAEAESRSEKARFDYPRFFKNESAGGKASTAAPQIPSGTVVVKAAGGC